MRAQTILCFGASILATMVVGCGGDDSAPSFGGAAPTYYKDVEPIVQISCGGCHRSGGIAPFSIDAGSAPSLARAMAKAVSDGVMPPWPPSPAGPPIVGERRISQQQIDTIAAWATAGAPLGDPADHRDRAPATTFDPGGPPDIVLDMKNEGLAYEPPSDTNQTDEVRCFVLDVGNEQNLWVRALEWATGTPTAIHHVGGMVVDPTQAAAARALSGTDGRPGYECAGGLKVTGISGFGANGAGSDNGVLMPSGAGVFVPAHASVILSMHYIIGNLSAPDQSGVRLWISPEKNLRPMIPFNITAPSELPCPTGVAPDDPANPDRCSRAYGIAQVTNQSSDAVKATNDYLLNHCKTTLADYYANIDFTQDPAHFYIPTGCEQEMAFDGIIDVVHAHMHTRGASARIEALSDDGTWSVLLDIPKYRWAWEGSYLLQQGIPVHLGQKLRVSCTYDNGNENQWSAVTNQPGHDGPAEAPLQPPHYVVAGPERGDDMCVAMLTVERAPYAGGTYADACREAQAIYDDACADGAVDFTSAPCDGQVELYAEALVETLPALVKAIWCGPKDAASKVGASCGDAMTCALTCSAKLGWHDLSASCVDACEANVNANDATQAPSAASAVASYQLEQLVACGSAECAGEATEKDYVGCLLNACESLAKLCYGQ